MLFHLPLLLLAAIATCTVIEPPESAFDPSPAQSASENQSLGQPHGLLSRRPSQDNSGGGDMLRVIVSLGGVLLLIYLLRFVILRAAGANTLSSAATGDDIFELLVRKPIARGQNLVLLRLGRRVILLHENTAAKSMTTLSEVADPEEAAALVERLTADRSRDGDAEIVDLTKRAGNGLTAWLSRTGGERT